MGNLCTKIPENYEKPYIKKNEIIVEKIVDIHPSEFNSDYSIKWDTKKKVYIYNLSKVIKLSNSKIVALGGVNKTNLKKLKLVNCNRFAYISNKTN